MRFRLPLLAFSLLALLRLTAAQEAEKPLYQPNGNEATISGTINVTGTIPRPNRIDMWADPVCLDRNQRPTVDWLLVNAGRLQNAFVYVKGESLNNYRFAVPDTEVVLDRRDCYFSPRVLGVRAGQRLFVANGDRTQHNTHPVPKLNPEWNMSAAPNSQPVVKIFTRPEMFIPVKCNQHPWEKAYLSVMDHPFFAVSDELGRFEIRGLPAGSYTLVVWHERLGEQLVEITVAPGESRNADFTFDVDKP